MKLTNHALAGALAITALLPIGCKSDPSASGAAAETETDPARDAVEVALRDLASKVSAQAAAGWPAHLPLSSSEPRRPVLSIDGVMNNTSFRMDMVEVEQRIAQSLLEGGHVVVAASSRDLDEAMDERAYGEASRSGAGQGAADVAGLTLVGDLDDEVVEVDGRRTHKVKLKLVIKDAVKRGILVSASGEATAVSER